MDKAEQARNKIIILYIVSRIPGITVGELTSMALDTCYMNYFTFATVFDELCTSVFLTKAVRKGEVAKDAEGNLVIRCDITPTGNEILSRLWHTIPELIHTFINNAANSWEKASRKNVEVKATFDPDFFGGYDVKLSLSDGLKDLISLRLSIPTKDMAILICKKWKDDTQAMYMEILTNLTKKSPS